MTQRRRRTQRRRPDGTAVVYQAGFSPRALPRLLFFVALVLLACHAALILYHYRVRELHYLVIQLFDVNQENNLPTWFSELLLLLTCALLWVCARSKRMARDRWWRHWYVLAAGFLLMAIDEVAGIHETINSVIEPSWAIPAGIAALLAGLAFLPFLLHLPRRTAVIFALAGAVYLAGAAGLEIIGNAMVAQRLQDTLQYNLTTLLEEGMEMFGVILFLRALLFYMRPPGSERVDVSAA